jgi:ABC-type transport system involved in cytochrome c biogenesis permease subunit
MLSLALLLQSGPDPDQIRRMVLTMMAVMPFILLVCLAIILIPTWFICKKAGFSPWLSLLTIVPFGGLILLYVLAFAEWKTVPAPPVAWQPPLSQPPAPPAFPPQA